MDDALENAKSIIVAQLRADSTLTRITRDILQTTLEDFRLRHDKRRHLTKSEKDILFKELIIYFTADLSYENDFVNLKRGEAVVDPERHVKWLPGIQKSFYWKKQREFLMQILSPKYGYDEAANVINSIDFETQKILENMENPIRLEFDSRGLVIGFVQSGKTANFAALISKAADAGYRFVIILAGIHDELRQQTQIRIDKELTGYNNLNLEGPFVQWNDLEENRRWINLTSAGWLDGKETGEFSGKGINKFRDVFLNRDRPVIAVIKKNVSIMKRLVGWINDSTESDRRNVPILIIDDEADQASIDGNALKEDVSPTGTNQMIRRILNSFHRISYVGYTATPFANVFIKYDSQDDNLEGDLYPRNFIHSLPEPPGYFGTTKIFANNLDDCFVKEVVSPRGEKNSVILKEEVPEALQKAIYTFIISVALRELRGDSKAPMSMLIHIDHGITKMNRIGIVISAFLETITKNIQYARLEKAYKELITSSQVINKKLNTHNSLFTEKLVVKKAIEVLKSKVIELKILNSSKEDKLDYAANPSMKVIALGGNKLSRGLTLEGLMTSYYLRETRQVDTLLQMGRWFGYRRNFEDLTRIYTSKSIWTHFKSIAKLELDFRESIHDMVKAKKTPREFAVAVQQISGLLPTSRNKLGAAELHNIYGGTQVNVTRLLLADTVKLDINSKQVRALVEKVQKSKNKFQPVGQIKDFPSQLARNVSGETVQEFIAKFEIAADEKNKYLDVNKPDLLRYIQSGNGGGSFTKWNVAIISIGEQRAKEQIIPLYNFDIRASFRSRLKGSRKHTSYNLKGISSKSDRKIDLGETASNEYDGRIVPLLLIYHIDQNSAPEKSSTGKLQNREPLFAGLKKEQRRNPVSYTIIFPPPIGGSPKWKQSIEGEE